MPLGVRIQWQNILLQLPAPSVDFKGVETGMFFLQIIHQAGPSKAGTDLRQGHEILSDNEFAFIRLGQVEEVAGWIKENWELAHDLNGLISLMLRILSLSPFPDIH